jgi:hypothetical protein
MDMITNFNAPIIPYYSPISAKGGKRRSTRKGGRALGSRKYRTRRHRRTNKSRTRRHH